jgi:predicted short-subunit dehydrogenase-like oxidoreductase (DUF2520 family)
MKVFILGAGKVGSTLAKGLRKAGVLTTLRSGRKGLPSKPIQADLLILALRDRDLGPTCEALAKTRLLGPKTAVVHCAGALPPEALLAVRGICAGIGQMHPMISFADARTPPLLKKGNMHVCGDAKAVFWAKKVARALGMQARTIAGLNPVGYHAAAAFLANGAAALAGVSLAVLEASKVPRPIAQQMLGPLLRSVADNLETLGLPQALTGPVRRGDAAGLGKHAKVLESFAPEALALYWELVRAQLPHAAALGETSKTAISEIKALLKR